MAAISVVATVILFSCLALDTPYGVAERPDDPSDDGLGDSSQHILDGAFPKFEEGETEKLNQESLFEHTTPDDLGDSSQHGLDGTFPKFNKGETEKLNKESLELWEHSNHGVAQLQDWKHKAKTAFEDYRKLMDQLPVIIHNDIDSESGKQNGTLFSNAVAMQKPIAEVTKVMAEKSDDETKEKLRTGKDNLEEWSNLVLRKVPEHMNADSPGASQTQNLETDPSGTHPQGSELSHPPSTGGAGGALGDGESSQTESVEASASETSGDGESSQTESVEASASETSSKK